MSIFNQSPQTPERSPEEEKALFVQQTSIFAQQTREHLARRYREAVRRLFGPHRLTIEERAAALGESLPEALATAQLIKAAVNEASPGYIPDDYIEQVYRLSYSYDPESGEFTVTHLPEPEPEEPFEPEEGEL